MQLEEIFGAFSRTGQMKKELAARHIECEYMFKSGVERIKFDDYELEIDHYTGESKMDMMVRRRGRLIFFHPVSSYDEAVKFLETHYVIPKLSSSK